MGRNDRLGEALLALDRVMPARAAAADPAIHALWLGGASGSGKSVLLLQLMQELVLEREERVIWLGEASWDFRPLVEAWCGDAAASRAGGPVFVFVDDFYAPVKRSRLALQELGNLVRHSGVADWPVLVTCGPSEQRYAMEQSEGNCGIRFEDWRMPLVTEDEEEQGFHFAERFQRTPVPP